MLYQGGEGKGKGRMEDTIDQTIGKLKLLVMTTFLLLTIPIDFRQNENI